MNSTRNFCTKISEQVFNDIHDLAESFGSQRKVIESAIESLKREECYKKYPHALEKLSIANDHNMAMISQKLFAYMVSETSFNLKPSLGLAFLKEYTNVPFEKLNNEELIYKISWLYVDVLHWIYKITTRNLDNIKYITFHHQYDSAFSEKISKYFVDLFEFFNNSVLNVNCDDYYFTIEIKRDVLPNVNKTVYD